MRTKTPFRRKRLISLGSSSSSSVEVKVERELQCSRCKAIFPDYLTRCPECGSEEWIGLVEVNPYTRMPMETFLKACGHLLWLVGTIGFLVLLWQTDSPDAETNKLFIYGAFLLLFCSVLFSAAYFGMSEIMRRILRMQRRLRAFHENYRDDQPGSGHTRAVQHKLAVRRVQGYGSRINRVQWGKGVGLGEGGETWGSSPFYRTFLPLPQSSSLPPSSSHTIPVDRARPDNV